jgi:hypothetical protein
MAFTTVDWIIVASIFFIFFTIAGVVGFIFLNRLRWNFKYVDIENIAGSGYTITRRGRCRKISFGDGGEEIFYLKGVKKFRVAYGKRIGKNYIAWGIGADGYAYNVSFSDLDKKLLEIGVFPVDRDMRYAYASARKGIENRYDKKNFMEKYGTVIAFGMLFICILAMGGFLWMGFNGQKEIQANDVEVAKTLQETMKLANDVLGRVDNIKSGGSGLVPAVP